MSNEETPSTTFWKKDSCPIPQPEMTPRPVTTTRFFSAFNCVEVKVRVVVVDGRRENALAVEITMRMRLGVANFILTWCTVCDMLRRRRSWQEMMIVTMLAQFMLLLSLSDVELEWCTSSRREKPCRLSWSTPQNLGCDVIDNSLSTSM